jgi:hypothetical protein
MDLCDSRQSFGAQNEHDLSPTPLVQSDALLLDLTGEDSSHSLLAFATCDTKPLTSSAGGKKNGDSSGRKRQRESASPKRFRPLKLSFSTGASSGNHKRVAAPSAKGDVFDADSESIKDSDDDLEGFASTKRAKQSPTLLYFQVSPNTGRVFLYNAQKAPLHINLSMDEIDFIGTEKAPELGQEIASDPKKLQIIKVFAKQWRALRPIEQKELCSTLIRPPVFSALQRLRSTKRAEEPCFERYASRGQSRAEDDEAGAASSFSGDICIECGKLVPEEIRNVGITSLCSRECHANRQAKLGSSAIRRQLFELESGVCQLCKVDAQAMYERVKALTPPERYQVLLGTKFRVHSKMLEKPTPGDFWQADHILAVALGGGHKAFHNPMANLRTLCTPCHEKETCQLRKSLKEIELAQAAKGTKDIRRFFTAAKSKPVVLEVE